MAENTDWDGGATMGRTKAKLIVYRRVSTARQGTSGLGLEGQNAVVADAPPAGVELVEHVGDLVALVILQGEPPAPLPLTRPGYGPSPRAGRLRFRPAH
jgi:hypothetical protein